MGSQSDYKIMKLCEKTLKSLGVSFETKIISAHRTPRRMYQVRLSCFTVCYLIGRLRLYRLSTAANVDIGIWQGVAMDSLQTGAKYKV